MSQEARTGGDFGWLCCLGARGGWESGCCPACTSDLEGQVSVPSLQVLICEGGNHVLSFWGSRVITQGCGHCRALTSRLHRAGAAVSSQAPR